MPYPSLDFTHELPELLRRELEAFIARLQGYLSQEHSDAGAHGQSGEWTPTDASGAGLSLTTFGSYVKWGEMVFAACRIDFPVTADATAVTIGGLPFTVENAEGFNFWGGTFTFTNVGNPSGTVICIHNTKTFQIWTEAAAQRTNAQFSGTVNTMFVTYRAAA